MLITVFTPTYNRASNLLLLYNSLLAQTYSHFEWVIVDDGSSDNTASVIHEYITEGKIDISYTRQENSGKHIAMNYGARLAKGELFFVLDSDDFLTPDSLDRVAFHWAQVQKLPSTKRENIIGVAGNIMFPTGQIVGDLPEYDILDTDLIDYRFQRKIRGDKAEIYLTDVVRENPFPKIANENFCPEALIFYRLAESGYKLRFFNENIYVCDYLEGGLSLDGLKTLKKGPIASLRGYSQVVGFSNVPFSIRLKFAILFWRFSFLDKKQGFATKLGMLPNLAFIFLYPLGLLLHLRDISKIS